MSDSAESGQRTAAVPHRADIEMIRVGRAVEGRLFGRPTVPLQVSRYLLLEEIARGGEGSVFAAYDPELDRKVAVKLLRPGSRLDGEQRLLREAQALAKLDHPNVIPVHDVGTYDFGKNAFDVAGTRANTDRLAAHGIYLVMEYAPGQDLRTWLEAEDPSWREIVEVFQQAGEGLAAAHRAGIVHRDFKPANVIRGLDERVRVVDFGLAQSPGAPSSKTAEASTAAAAAESPRLTQPGFIAGTPAFMSPEQHRGGPIDARSDQYSFCVSLYAALYGKVPFMQTGVAELERAKSKHEFVRRPNARVPRWLDRLVATGMAADPTKRHPSMDVVCAELGRARLSRRRAVVGVLGVASAGAVWIASRAETPRCPDSQTFLQGVWDAEHKASLRQAVQHSGIESADRLASALEGQLDEYAAQWTRARTDVCEAGLDGSFSPERVSAAEFCLDRSLVRLGGVVQMLAEVEPRVAARGRIVVTTLPRVSTCVERPVALSEPPTLRQRGDLLAIESDISKARILVLAGRSKDAVEISTSAVERARTLGREGPLAHALLQLSMSRGPDAAADSANDLREAIASAEAAGDPELAIECTAKLAFVMSVRQGEINAGLALLDLADARAAQLESNAFSQRHRLALRGQIFAAAQDYEQARTTWERALELESAAKDRRPAVMAELEQNLGVLAHLQLRYDDALAHLERAWELEDTKIPGANSIGNIALSAGQVLLDARRPKDAIVWLERALQILDEESPLATEAKTHLRSARSQTGQAEDMPE